MDNIYLVLRGVVLSLFGVFMVVFRRQFTIIIHRAQKNSPLSNKIINDDNNLKYSENISLGVGLIIVIFGVVLVIKSL